MILPNEHTFDYDLLRQNTIVSSVFYKKEVNFLFKNQRKLFNENKLSRPNEMKDWQEDSITYKLNNFGYRSNKDFVKGDECNAYIGCSYTLGEEVNYKDIWPTLVNKKLNDYKLYNLGVPGAGPETCYRVLKGFINFANIKRVFLLLPLSDRRELYYCKQWSQVKANSSVFSHRDIISGFFTREEAYINKLRNLDAIKFLCQSNNIPLYVLDLNDTETEKTVVNDATARDLLHPGKSAHATFAEIYLKMVNCKTQ